MQSIESLTVIEPFESGWRAWLEFAVVLKELL